MNLNRVLPWAIIFIKYDWLFRLKVKAKVVAPGLLHTLRLSLPLFTLLPFMIRAKKVPSPTVNSKGFLKRYHKNPVFVTGVLQLSLHGNVSP